MGSVLRWPPFKAKARGSASRSPVCLHWFRCTTKRGVGMPGSPTWSGRETPVPVSGVPMTAPRSAARRDLGTREGSGGSNPGRAAPPFPSSSFFESSHARVRNPRSPHQPPGLGPPCRCPARPLRRTSSVSARGSSARPPALSTCAGPAARDARAARGRGPTGPRADARTPRTHLGPQAAKQGARAVPGRRGAGQPRDAARTPGFGAAIRPASPPAGCAALAAPPRGTPARVRFRPPARPAERRVRGARAVVAEPRSREADVGGVGRGRAGARGRGGRGPRRGFRRSRVLACGPTPPAQSRGGAGPRGECESGAGRDDGKRELLIRNETRPTRRARTRVRTVGARAGIPGSRGAPRPPPHLRPGLGRELQRGATQGQGGGGGHLASRATWVLLKCPGCGPRAGAPSKECFLKGPVPSCAWRGGEGGEPEVR